MKKFITIGNAGKILKKTNYWDSEIASSGIIFFSVNAGCIRMLIPDIMAAIIPEIKTGKKIIISRGPWPAQGKDDGLEILFEDYSDSPYMLHVSTKQWDMLPEKKSAGKKWEFAAYTKSKRIFSKKCYYRVVDQIPYMKPWGE